MWNIHLGRSFTLLGALRKAAGDADAKLSDTAKKALKELNIKD